MYLDLRKLPEVGSVCKQKIAIIDRINPTINTQKEIPFSTSDVDLLDTRYCYLTAITSKSKHPKPRSTP